jgi:hypothetical protein
MSIPKLNVTSGYKSLDVDPLCHWIVHCAGNTVSIYDAKTFILSTRSTFAGNVWLIRVGERLIYLNLCRQGQSDRVATLTFEGVELNAVPNSDWICKFCGDGMHAERSASSKNTSFVFDNYIVVVPHSARDATAMQSLQHVFAFDSTQILCIFGLSGGVSDGIYDTARQTFVDVDLDENGCCSDICTMRGAFVFTESPKNGNDTISILSTTTYIRTPLPTDFTTIRLIVVSNDDNMVILFGKTSSRTCISAFTVDATPVWTIGTDSITSISDIGAGMFAYKVDRVRMEYRTKLTGALVTTIPTPNEGMEHLAASDRRCLLVNRGDITTTISGMDLNQWTCARCKIQPPVARAMNRAVMYVGTTLPLPADLCFFALACAGCAE